MRYVRALGSASDMVGSRCALERNGWVVYWTGYLGAEIGLRNNVNSVVCGLIGETERSFSLKNL
jgi:hypothetical protein